MFLWTMLIFFVWFGITYLVVGEINKFNLLFGLASGLTIGFIITRGDWRKNKQLR